jgi:serine/threonine protein kinase
MRSESDLAALLKALGVELTHYKAGSGGSAVVHRARVAEHNPQVGPGPGLDVAIKEYNDEVIAKKEQSDRIRQEVEVGRLVQHPNIVPIHSLIDDGQATPLLVMDWVSGLPLDGWCNAETKTSDWEGIRRIALGLVDGLLALHERGIKHRDVKPANVFVTATGDPILMDMGVVEVATNDEHTLHTSVADFIGSVRYAAPQFIRGETFEFPDDVYSLGATLYLAVTGKEVFAGVDRKPLLPYYILTERPRVGEVTTGLPSQLSVLLEGALHPDRKRRPTLKEIREFLQAPETAPYLQRELDARNKEQRGFEVIAIYDEGATVLADLRGAETRYADYSVVRELRAVRVPSLGGSVKPEKWIADVQLKHVHNGVGHFAVQGKRWQPGKPNPLFRTLSADFGGSPGEWVEYDKQTDAVKIGDVVVESKS